MVLLPAIALASQAPLDDPLVTGVACYIAGLAALTAWESYAVPRLQARSILPDVPLLPGQLTQKEKAVPWILPWTADLPVPPPPYEELGGRFRIGVVDGVGQFLTKEEGEEVRGVREKSEEWSAYYGKTVYVYKLRIL